jgi:hypothetical protein
MIKVVLLILMALTKDGEHPMVVMAMPPGTSVKDCEADHTPAADAMSDGVIKFGYKCVEVDLLPTSKA